MARQEITPLPAALAAAQEQLHRRRHRRRQERLDQHLPVHTDDSGRLTLPSPAQTTKERRRLNPRADLISQPPRVAQQQRQVCSAEAASQSLAWLPTRQWRSQEEAKSQERPSLSEKHKFTIYPDLAIAMLRDDLVAPGRVWHLLRYLDGKGCGWVDVARARALLTEKGSSYRICGWRQLRNLLAQGDDFFWQRHDGARQDDRIWLRSPEKVAFRLGVRRFSKRPVTAPLNVLLDGIGTVRAHFFASFHSGRDASNPIARKTLENLTGVSRRSQQIYEKKAGVKTQQHWAIGGAYSKQEAQRCAWKQGNALFILHDYQGRIGATGQSYLAWQLPNSYVGPHTPQALARKKRINRRLVDLFNKGKTGNDKKEIEETPFDDGYLLTRYFEHGRAAARAYTRRASNDLYWPAPASYGSYKVWHLLPAQNRHGRCAR